MSEPAYLAIDPGETSGWATWDDKGNILAMGQFKQSEQNKWLDEHIKPTLKEVIVEDYKNYAWQKQKKWSQNQTSKNIGAIEMICELRGVPYVLQGAAVKKIGYKYAGLGEAPSNHAISHQYDAIAHGEYRLNTIGVKLPKIG